MPRTPRVFVEGGIYHVYNRFASGEAVFADPEAAREFIELLRFVKKRDGWTVFAWVLMTNHYHLAIRSRAVPISQGFHYLQGTFSRRFNRSRGRTGALWQSRYHAKAINEQRYLDRVVLYIHLNSVPDTNSGGSDSARASNTYQRIVTFLMPHSLAASTSVPM